MLPNRLRSLIWDTPNMKEAWIIRRVTSTSLGFGLRHLLRVSHAFLIWQWISTGHSFCFKVLFAGVNRNLHRQLLVSRKLIHSHLCAGKLTLKLNLNRNRHSPWIAVLITKSAPQYSPLPKIVYSWSTSLNCLCRSDKLTKSFFFSAWLHQHRAQKTYLSSFGSTGSWFCSHLSRCNVHTIYSQRWIPSRQCHYVWW